MLHHFPQPDIAYPHRIWDYFIAALTFICVALSLNIDASGSVEQQNFMGIIAWTFLLALLLRENKEIRMQVIVAVAFATAGEHFASIYMGGYTYRFGNVPAYVPPGHGMVYLTAVALARSGFFLRYSRKIAAFVVLTCGRGRYGESAAIQSKAIRLAHCYSAFSSSTSSKAARQWYTSRLFS